MKEDLSYFALLYLSHKAITLKRGGGPGSPVVCCYAPELPRRVMNR